jgi:prefoldin subunit 5
MTISKIVKIKLNPEAIIDDWADKINSIIDEINEKIDLIDETIQELQNYHALK